MKIIGVIPARRGSSRFFNKPTAKILGKPILITNYTTANSQINHEFDGYITDLSIEGIADGIEKLYRNERLRNKLESNCKNTNYSNNYELYKLYELFNR